MRHPQIFNFTTITPYGASQAIDLGTLLNPNITGGVAASANRPTNVEKLIAYLNITVAPGVDTVLLQLQEFNPASNAWTDVPGAATLAQVATGLVKLIVGPNLAEVAASASIRVLSQPVPPIWRLNIVHSGAGSFTYTACIGVEAG